MKRLFSATCIFFIASSLFSGCSAAPKSTQQTPSETPEHQLYLDIAFESNLLMSKYDVDVFLDDTQIGSIKHGENFTKTCSAKEGEHQLIFYKDGDQSIKGSTPISVSEEATFKCTIHASGSEIKIDAIQMLDSIVGSSIKMENASGLNLQEVLDMLIAKGFVNVQSKAEDGDSIWDNSNWTVIHQNVEPGKEIDKNEAIILTCIKTEGYLNNMFAGMSIAEARAKAQELGYSKVTFENTDSYADVTSQVETMSKEDAKHWLVEKVKESSSDKKIIIVSIKSDQQTDLTVPEPVVDNPQEPATQPQTETNASSQSGAIITVKNNKEFSKIMKGDDLTLNRAFTEKYMGRTIEFDGNIAYLSLHGSYKTRWDFLIYAWDYSEDSVTGAHFQFRDCGINDLHITGDDTSRDIEMGQNIHVIAKIVGYTNGDLILLEPISISFR